MVVGYVDQALDALLTELPTVMLTGPRGCGKTTTATRRAESTVQLDRPEQAAAFAAAPDEVLGALTPPVLIDEWQNAPESLSAIKRASTAGRGAPGFSSPEAPVPASWARGGRGTGLDQ